jgi:tetratricopeptide (TPR) repeat protein
MLALNPLDGRALSLGSGALFEDGQTERAIEWAQRALELYPDYMGTLVNAACLRSKLGKRKRRWRSSSVSSRKAGASATG